LVKVVVEARKRTSVPVSPSASPTPSSGFDRLAVLEAGVVFLAVAPDAQLEPVGQRVDHRDADAVQAAGDLVGVLVELPAGVQLGHDDLGRRDALLLVDAHGDAAAVVGDRRSSTPSGVERHDVTRASAWPASASSMALSTTS
jgi:hypothetical protein